MLFKHIGTNNFTKAINPIISYRTYEKILKDNYKELINM